MNTKLSPAKAAVVGEFIEEIKQYTTEEIETVVRDIVKRDMRMLRRQYPELFRRELGLPPTVVPKKRRRV